MKFSLATGQRQGDLIRFRWDDIDSGVIRRPPALPANRMIAGLRPPRRNFAGGEKMATECVISLARCAASRRVRGLLSRHFPPSYP